MALISFVILCLLIVVCSEDHSLGGFFGDAIQWRTYHDGYYEVINSKKPGMVVFHRSYCGACKRLGEQVQQSPSLIQMTKQFVMISCDGSNDPQGPAFEVDGTYVPRIYFLNPNNTINHSIVSNDYQYRYFYSSAQRLQDKMKEFLDKLDNDVDDEL